MLSLILIWAYILFVSGLLGLAVLSLFERREQIGMLRPDTAVMTGLVILTVYAQLFSLIYKVGLAANLVLLLLCAGIVAIWHGRILQNFRRMKAGIRPWQWFVWGILFLFFVYGASRGMIHYDTSLYHAQSIRWLEEYGAVKGLGNLHNRLAYNSAAFSLSALFSFSFVNGQSFHGVAGFFAWLLACTCTDIADFWKRKRAALTDFVILVAIYYLTTIFNQMISPESDYFMNIVVLFLLIHWCRLLERGEKSVTPYALLCVLGVYAVTLKLTAALVLLLVIKPAALLIRRKDGKGILLYLCLGTLVVAPYLIRNVVLSGWLVYPFPAVDLFPMDWKIPAGVARWDAAEIKVYGRGLTDAALAEQGFQEWFPGWLKGLSKLNLLLVLGSFLAFACDLIWGIRILVKKRWHRLDAWLLQLTCGGCFLFWLNNAPLVRYGFIFIGLSTGVLIGNIYIILQERLPLLRYQVFLVMLGIFALWKTVSMGKQIASDYVNDYWFVQKDYDNFRCTSYMVGGVEVFYPETGDRVGYDAFPSTPYRRAIELRGIGIEDGFRAVGELE